MAQILFIYLLKVIVCSSVLVTYYWLALRNKRFHYYNRFYLLSALFLSVLLPLLHLQLFNFSGHSSQTIHLLNIINAHGEEDIIIGANKAVDYEQLLLFAVAVISAVMIILLCFSIIKIYSIKKKYAVNKTTEFDFINTDIQQAPFSFLKNIFWRNDISLQHETGKQILQHEITHIKQKHSWDKIFIQTLLCFYWINPFFWLIKKELFLIHEFIADEKAIGENDASAFAKMLLASQYGKFQFLPAQSIFYSPIKRRLTMLTTSQKPQFSYARRLMVLPLLAIVITLFSFTVNNEINHTVIKTSASFKLVVDAGHGGKDYGALGNGLYEKDATLKIAEKIKALSSQYGIDVILTRDNDVFMSPPEKSEFANAQNANAFISIHISSALKDEQAEKSGVEVYVSERNKNLLQQSQVLGSSILENMNADFKPASALNTRNAGIWVMDNSKIPSALIECGYITNASDAAILKDDAKIELMAKNILQGIAMYANNKVDTTNLYQLKTVDDTTPVQHKENAIKSPSTPVSFAVDSTAIKSNKNVPRPLYVLNGKIIKEEEMKNIEPKTIESLYVLKDKDATDKYGDKGKYGVIEMYLKNDTEKKELQQLSAPPPQAAEINSDTTSHIN
ncbi:MAG: N-acetylmuramoyl-L-alanine amidase [Parafilimonas sp.]